MQKGQIRSGIIFQVAILFAVGVLVTGLLTYLTQRSISDSSVKRQTEALAAEVSEEVTLAVKEYPAYEWLFRYWCTCADDLDIEYDVGFEAGTATEEKCRTLSERYPGIQLKYLDIDTLRTMSAEDQRLYAEITYSWLITRVNEIKVTYQIDYLFCVLTDESYKTQFFVFSAAEPGTVRGTNYEEVYTLGMTVEVTESQQEAMRSARLNAAQLADAGEYVDYYRFLDESDGHILLVGMTYNLSALRADIHAQTQRGTASAMSNQIVLSLICLCLMFFYVLRPLKKIQQAIRQYQQAKDSETVAGNLATVNPPNEIGQLSEDVIALSKEIDDYLIKIAHITAEKERIGTELALATRIQADMLPNIYPAFPERLEFDIYATMTPAKEVGGDFYDFFLIDENHLGLVMADVSGKGVPAALFMMVSKILVQNFAMTGRSPAETLKAVNDQICANNREEMFVTVWFGVLDTRTGVITAANAGHEYPALMPAGGKFELIKDRHGFVIGGMEGMRYKEYELQLTPGAKLFLYTDGVPEATDANKELFGTDRMLEALNADTAATPEQVLKNVRAAVDGFVKEAEQFDDLTMLCLEYRGNHAIGDDRDKQKGELQK